MIGVDHAQVETRRASPRGHPAGDTRHPHGDGVEKMIVNHLDAQPVQSLGEDLGNAVHPFRDGA